jgi:hypothetical protein
LEKKITPKPPQVSKPSGFSFSRAVPLEHTALLIDGKSWRLSRISQAKWHIELVLQSIGSIYQL